jgi:hypothetical protein
MTTQATSRTLLYSTCIHGTIPHAIMYDHYMICGPWARFRRYVMKQQGISSSSLTRGCVHVAHRSKISMLVRGDNSGRTIIGSGGSAACKCVLRIALAGEDKTG